MPPDNDTHHHPVLALALSAAVIALSVSYSVDAEPLSPQAAEAAMASPQPQLPEALELPTLAPSAIVLQSASAYKLEQGKAKFYFAPSKTELTPLAEDALKDIAAALQKGQRAHITGFHDETGNAQQNITLSQKRSEAVRKRLVALGAPSTAIQILKPAVGSTTGSHSEARRVEVAVLP